MAYNWAKDASATLTLTNGYRYYDGLSSQSTSGSVGNLVDENDNTSFSQSCTATVSGPGSSTARAYVQLLIEFSSSHTISELKGIFKFTTSGTVMGSDTIFSIRYYDGSWKYKDSQNLTDNWGITGESTSLNSKLTKDYASLNHTNVTKVLIYISASPGDGRSAVSIISELFEFYVYGEDNIVAPSITTGSASLIGASTATLGGNITDLGGENNTIRGFQYGLTNSYGSDVHEDGSYGTGAYTLGITGLLYNTLYYFRAYSTNSAGTSYGAEQTFTTLPIKRPMVLFRLGLS
jgi:hypothetical protein